jgi:hypothetical protein
MVVWTAAVTGALSAALKADGLVARKAVPTAGYLADLMVSRWVGLSTDTMVLPMAGLRAAWTGCSTAATWASKRVWHLAVPSESQTAALMVAKKAP